MSGAAAAAAAAITLRPGRDADAPGIIALIRACWAEYPGCVFDLDGEVPELRALASWFAARGGALWVAEGGAATAGRILGMIGVKPPAAEEGGAWEICRLYIAAEQRGGSVAHRLLDTAEAHARAAGAARLALWSDTRFERAHAFYEKRGYLRTGPVRVLHDLSNSLEFGFAKPARGLVVQALDAAAAASAERRLAAILIGGVAAGDPGCFLPPLAVEAARGVWRGVAAEVAAGRGALLAAWLDGALVGAARLRLAMPEAQRHRAELAMPLVDPAARRRGVGRALMAEGERVARDHGRRLLTLHPAAIAGGAGEALCRAAPGWREAGRIPGYALDAGGAPRDAVAFWKALPP